MVRGDRASRKNRLFVGITSWNSETFIGHCIDAVKRTTSPADTRIVVLDNDSVDNSRHIAGGRNVEVVNLKSNQPQALNYLLNLSNSEFTLLIHADVILLSDKFLDLCASYLQGDVAMISPEDIGCGPYTRPWGKGMPESSFMLFRTSLIKAARRWFRIQRFKIRWPYRAVDFYGEHITYNLPGMLKEKGLTWKMMDVHTSVKEPRPIYTPGFQPKYWDESWGLYRYGLGNFYSIDGQITHYHNWFDRTVTESLDVSEESQATFPKEGGLPLAYVKVYTDIFISDLQSGKLIIPDISAAETVPISGAD